MNTMSLLFFILNNIFDQLGGLCVLVIYCLASFLFPYVTPPPGPHHPNSFQLRAGLEPGIPAREAGALTRNAKGYSR